MSLTTAALRELVALGLTAEQILTVAEAQGEPAAVRSAGAERQARYRARQAEKEAETVTRNVTSDASFVTPEPTHSFEEIIPPSPPKGGSSPTGAALAEPRARKPKAGSRFVPADFTPSPDHHAKAEAMGLTAGDLERALNRFRNHEFPRPYTDWNRTFTNWLDREKPSDDRNSNDQRRASYSQPSRAERDQSAALEVLARRGALPRQDFGRDIHELRPSGAQGTGGGTVALLPTGHAA